MANLASIWNDQNREADALQLMNQCLELQIKVLGETHPHTLYTMMAVIQWSELDLDSLSSITGYTSTSGDK